MPIFAKVVMARHCCHAQQNLDNRVIYKQTNVELPSC